MLSNSFWKRIKKYKPPAKAKFFRKAVISIGLANDEWKMKAVIMQNNISVNAAKSRLKPKTNMIGAMISIIIAGYIKSPGMP